MVYITSPAAVRMAKAGKALEKAVADYQREWASQKGGMEMKPYFDEWHRAEAERKEAVAVVMAELYEQNMHLMTGPA